jgi:hypothetical protein
MALRADASGRAPGGPIAAEALTVTGEELTRTLGEYRERLQNIGRHL